MITLFGPFEVGFLTKVTKISLSTMRSTLTSRSIAPRFTSTALEGVNPSDAVDRPVAQVVKSFIHQSVRPYCVGIPPYCSGKVGETGGRLSTNFCLMSFTTCHAAKLMVGARKSRTCRMGASDIGPMWNCVPRDMGYTVWGRMNREWHSFF